MSKEDQATSLEEIYFWIVGVFLLLLINYIYTYI